MNITKLLPILFLLFHHYMISKWIWLNLFSMIGILYYLISSLSNKKKINKKINKIKLSILIPAYNEESTIKKCIQSIQKQTYPLIEKIVVVNDGSSDNTANIVEQLINDSTIPIELINHQMNSGKCAIALNSGLKVIKTSYVLVINGDSWFTNNNAIAQGVFTLLSKNSHACNYNLEPIQKPDKIFFLLGSIQRKFKNWYFSNFQAYLNNGFIVNKDKYLQMGWKEDEITEDVWLSNKIIQSGGTIEQVPNCSVADYLPMNFKQLFQQNYRWVHGEFLNIINRQTFYPNNMEEYVINVYYTYFILQCLPFFWNLNILIFSTLILTLDVLLTYQAINNVYHSLLFVIYNNLCNLLTLLKMCFEKEYIWVKIKKE